VNSLNTPVGALLITVAMLVILYAYLKIISKPSKRVVPDVSQATLHHRFNSSKKRHFKNKQNTQSEKHYNDTNVKVIIVENEAYWIKGNIFFKAKMVNNLIDPESTEQVDTMSMDKVQLEKMLFIMDKLREGISDDSRGTGNK
jgi:hypothetical protein